MKSKAKYIAEGALTAALYVLLTVLSAAFGLSGGVIQLRLSEALCVLPLFMPSSVIGLFVGCIIANIITGAVVADVIVGSLATLIAAAVLSLMKRIPKMPAILAPLPNIVFNTAAVPFVLRYAYGVTELLPYLFLTVGVGEIVSSGVLGCAFAAFLGRHKDIMKLG